MFSRTFSRISILLAILAAVLMTACGGGSGSPSNPIKVDLSEQKIMYGPLDLTINGGSPPFCIQPSSTGIVFNTTETSSVCTSNYVSTSRKVSGFVYPFAEDGTVTIQVWDRIQGPAHATVAPLQVVAAPVIPTTLTVTATGNTGCTTGQGGNYTQICAGSSGVAELQLGGIGGVAAGQPVRFSVVMGDYQIQENSNMAWGTVANATTDSAGIAQVAIQTKANATTQNAKIRADFPSLLGSGIDTLVTTFVIVGSNFVILPGDVTFTSSTATCPARSASFAIYGGVPPYSVFAAPATVSPSTVSASGGTVTLTTNGCGSGSITARDATGSQATATFSYTAGSSTTPPTTADVVTSAIGGWGTSASRVSCAANSTFMFTVTGGTSPYSWFTVPPVPGVTFPQTLGGAVGSVIFPSAPAAANTNYALYVLDKDGKQSITTPTIYCQ